MICCELHYFTFTYLQVVQKILPDGKFEKFFWSQGIICVVLTAIIPSLSWFGHLVAYKQRCPHCKVNCACAAFACTKRAMLQHSRQISQPSNIFRTSCMYINVPKMTKCITLPITPTDNNVQSLGFFM